MNWEPGVDVRALSCVKQTASGSLQCRELSSALVVMYTGGWVEGEVQEEGDMCTHTADSLPCTAETNIVQHLYSK